MNAEPLAVLISGGLDSAILLAESLRTSAAVHPLYVRMGLFWEGVELRHLHRFLDAVHGPALKPLQILEMPVGDLYGPHWSITGRDVPRAGTADEAVFLPGRNVLLLAKTLLWCPRHAVPAVALGSLASNPFPDATPAFFDGFQDTVNRAAGGAVRILRPFANLDKNTVMNLGRRLPLELTFSCIRPVGDEHCGECNKCAERQQAFAAAGIRDLTPYAR
jgi:7-cyano-7-deazaguanine synthase